MCWPGDGAGVVAHVVAVRQGARCACAHFNPKARVAVMRWSGLCAFLPLLYNEDLSKSEGTLSNNSADLINEQRKQYVMLVVCSFI